MATINENKFYQALENFYRCKYWGDSGYVNLLKIKSTTRNNFGRV